MDSVHSTLECLLKPPIYTPSDYINIIRKALPSKPYIVHQLDTCHQRTTIQNRTIFYLLLQRLCAIIKNVVPISL